MTVRACWHPSVRGADGWTAWNHVRTFASLAGATVFTVALTAD